MGLIAMMEDRASISDADDRWYMPNTPSSAANIDVNDDTALTLSAWWCGVTILASAMGSVPMKLYQELPDGGRKAVRDHPLFRVVHRRPNSWMTPFELESMKMGHLLTRGNFYAQKVVSMGGRLLELVPLNPTRVKVVVEDGRVRYRFDPLQGATEYFEAWEILHLRGLSHNGLVGFCPITAARESLGMALAAQKHGARFFANYARPGGVLRTDSTLRKETRDAVRQGWMESQGGQNTLKPAVLEGGLEWQAIGISNADAEWLGSITHGVVEVARWLNLPPHKLKELTRSTFSNIEHQSLEFVVDSVTPWAVNQEQRYNVSFLTERELDQGYYFKYNLEALLRGDSASRAQFYQMLFNMASLSPNEIREKEEMNPVPGGDQRFVQLNLVPLDRVGNLFGNMAGGFGAEEEDDEERGSTPLLEMRRLLQVRSVTMRRRYRLTYEALFLDTASRLVRKETRAVNRIVTAELTSRSIPSLLTRLLEFYEGFQRDVRDAFLPLLAAYMDVVGEAAAEEINEEFKKEGEVQQFVQDYADAMAARHVRSSSGQLRKLVEETEPDELEDALRGRLNDWDEKRPTQMAHRETVQAGGAFADLIYTAAAMGTVWVASGRSCPLCSAMDGRRSGPQQGFLSQGETVDPGDGKTTPLTTSGPVRHPPLHDGCECLIAAAF
jgi:HK97 family phage portal protein